MADQLKPATITSRPTNSDEKTVKRRKTVLIWNSNKSSIFFALLSMAFGAMIMERSLITEINYINVQSEAYSR